MTGDYFVWDAESYSVGDAILDGQHKRLLSVLNRLYVLVREGDGMGNTAGTGAMMQELTNYIVEHFAYEEQRMLESGYPLAALQHHRAEHDGFVETVRGFESRLVAGDSAALNDLLPYLYGDWLIQHICGSDRAYRGYLRPQAADGIAKQTEGLR